MKMLAHLEVFVCSQLGESDASGSLLKRFVRKCQMAANRRKRDRTFSRIRCLNIIIIVLLIKVCCQDNLSVLRELRQLKSASSVPSLMRIAEYNVHDHSLGAIGFQFPKQPCMKCSIHGLIQWLGQVSFRDSSSM